MSELTTLSLDRAVSVVEKLPVMLLPDEITVSPPLWVSVLVLTAPRSLFELVTVPPEVAVFDVV